MRKSIGRGKRCFTDPYRLSHPSLEGNQQHSTVSPALGDYFWIQTRVPQDSSTCSTDLSMRHLRRFLRLWDTVNQPNTSKKYIGLIVFPFSLNGKACKWFGALPENSITNWTQCSNIFLKKYFFVMKIDKLNRDIGNFTQSEQQKLGKDSRSWSGVAHMMDLINKWWHIYSMEDYLLTTREALMFHVKVIW